jgi:hypothetical protein
LEVAAAVKEALAVVKRAITRGGEDLVEAAEHEPGELRAAIEQYQAEAQRFAADWLHAASQDAAEQFDRQRREALRLIERDTARMPGLEARVVAAKAEKQRQGLARHRAAIAAFVPKLVRAVEVAAEVQVEAIKLREAAVAELVENVVAATIPHLAFNGLLLPDLAAMWRHEVERMFAPPAAHAPRPVAAPAPAKASALKPIAAPPAPRPHRALRQDPPAAEDQCAIIFIRGSGVELPDGTQAMVGDRCNVSVDEARLLVLRGVADYAKGGAA